MFWFEYMTSYILYRYRNIILNSLFSILILAALIRNIIKIHTLIDQKIPIPENCQAYWTFSQDTIGSSFGT